MRTSLLLAALIATAHAQLTEPPTVRIGVLSLFHPQTLILTSTQPLALTLDAQTFTLPPNHAATIHATPNGLTLETPAQAGETLTVTPASFTLTVPAKLTRLYRGSLTITAKSGTLIPIIAMPTELAVASIVQAESPPHASLEALKAQAVISRSFLLAQLSRHPDFDACDTTHCQFLRSPPPARSPASIATRATRNQVLTWRSTPDAPAQIVPAMYSRSCGGHTRAHPTSSGAYPFYSVACSYCLRHPERWNRTLPPASQPPGNEKERLAFNRTHGWSAIPSNTHSASGDSIAGRGTGHGIGLCQLGANDLAARGASYEKIVSHFFPNTTLSNLQ
jgi:stage II sporulation protein D